MHTNRSEILWKRRACRLIRGHFKSNGTIGVICNLLPRRQKRRERMAEPSQVPRPYSTPSSESSQAKFSLTRATAACITTKTLVTNSFASRSKCESRTQPTRQRQTLPATLLPRRQKRRERMAESSQVLRPYSTPSSESAQPKFSLTRVTAACITTKTLLNNSFASRSKCESRTQPTRQRQTLFATLSPRLPFDSRCATLPKNLREWLT